MWNFPPACDTRWNFHLWGELCFQQPQEVSPRSWIARFSPGGWTRSIFFKPDRWSRHAASQCRLLSSHPARQPHPEHFTLIYLGHLIGERRRLKLTLSFLSVAAFYETKMLWGAVSCGCSPEGAGGQTPKKSLSDKSEPVWFGVCEWVVIPVMILNRSLRCPFPFYGFPSPILKVG